MVFVRDFKKEFYEIVQHQVCWSIILADATRTARRTTSNQVLRFSP